MCFPVSLVHVPVTLIYIIVSPDSVPVSLVYNPVSSIPGNQAYRYLSPDDGEAGEEVFVENNEKEGKLQPDKPNPWQQILFPMRLRASAPIGARKCIFPPFSKIMTDRPTNQPKTNRPTDGHEGVIGA